METKITELLLPVNWLYSSEFTYVKTAFDRYGDFTLKSPLQVTGNSDLNGDSE